MKLDKKVKEIMLNNMLNEIKHLNWAFHERKTEAFERTLANIVEEIFILKKEEKKKLIYNLKK